MYKIFKFSESLVWGKIYKKEGVSDLKMFSFDVIVNQRAHTKFEAKSTKKKQEIKYFARKYFTISKPKLQDLKISFILYFSP